MNQETKIKGNPTGETKAMGGIAIKKIVTIGEDNDLNGNIVAALRDVGMDVFPMKTPADAFVFCEQNKKVDLIVMMMLPDNFREPPQMEVEELSVNEAKNDDEVQGSMGNEGVDDGAGAAV